MTLSTYLFRRGKRGIWQLRVPVPREYQRSHGGPPEKIKSMRTSDRALAVKRALPILSEWQAEWERAKAQWQTPAPAPATKAHRHVDDVAVEVAFENLLAALEAQRRVWPTDDEGYGKMADKRRADIRRFARALDEGDISRWLDLADRMVATRGLDLAQDGHTRESYAAILGELNIDAMDVFYRRTEGEIGAEPKSKVVRNLRAARANKAKPGETLLDLYDDYARWRCEPGRKRRRRPESFTQDRVVVELFAEFVGSDRDVASITKEEAKRFRAMLPDFPTSRSKNRKLAKATFGESKSNRQRLRLSAIWVKAMSRCLLRLAPARGATC